MRIITIFLLLILFWQQTNGFKVLFYLNAIGKSHLDFADSLIDSLVGEGHQVDLIIARMNDKAKGFGKNKATRKYSFGFEHASPWSNSTHLLNPFITTPFAFGGFRPFIEVGNRLCQMGLEDETLPKFISDAKYDVGIVSVFDFCGVGILKAFGIPSITTFSPIPMLPIQLISIGLPNLASQYTPVFSKRDLTTFTGKFWNLLSWGYSNWVEIPETRAQQIELFRTKFGDTFDLMEAVKSVDVSFVNSNEIMEKPRPIHHRIQYIGGINLRDPKPVNEEFDRLLSQSTKGTIIFSFGTQVPSEVYPRYAVRNFVTIFKKYHDYTFLWKYDIQEGEEKLFADAHNVFTLDWLPQTDLLYDPRVIGFISHVGLNSFNEASYAGKPIVAIPLFADQPHNAENGVLRGTTYLLDKTDLNEDSIDKGISAIINDPSYRETSQILSKMLTENPSQPKDRFVKWVEFAAANPGLHKIFELPGATMSVFEYYCIDVITLISLITIISALSIYYVVIFTLNSMRLKRKQD